jgi:all-trans-nonaprenyl-diphosphate synthase
MPATLSIQECTAPINAQLALVKASIKNIVPPESRWLAEALGHSLGGEGKLLRPVLTLLMAKGLGLLEGTHDTSVIETASVAEMIHVATLLHDDVLDDADLRRGRETVRAIWGNSVSILTGDYLLAQASLKLSQIGNIRLVAIYSHVLSHLCDGEVEQLRTSYQLSVDWDSYLRKSIGKTASLFSAACESAGVLAASYADLTEDDIQRLASYGKNFGIAFQIIDDLLDYTATEAELGKPVLGDLRSGLLNAPVLLALGSNRLDDTAKAGLRAEIEGLFTTAQAAQAAAAKADDESSGATVALDAQVAHHIAAIQNYLTQAQALDATLALANDYAQCALAGLAPLAPGPAKEALEGLVHLALTRKK